eukprot:TRINITY_DN73952_c0_g1_i1.p1 TRINITY_DN73952_c0_g1~~TRINITY_DN73952_c0_g1_i1.p1  ORF type:complete len:620 (+),score=108.34 TRINITY_DN73952_c0_g1_i1:147-2006(+)
MPVITSKSAHSAALKRSKPLVRSRTLVANQKDHANVEPRITMNQSKTTSGHRSTAWEERVPVSVSQHEIEPPPVEYLPEMDIRSPTQTSRTAFIIGLLPLGVQDCLDAGISSFIQNILGPADPHPELESYLNKVVGVVIVLNTFMMGLEVDFAPQTNDINQRLFWFVSESFFISFFVFEMCVRMFWERGAWPLSLWNWLDVVVISIAVAETWLLPFLGGDVSGNLQMLTLLRIVRLARLIRVVRLVRMFRTLYVCVIAFKEACVSILNIGVVMTMGLYVCAIFTTSTIGRSPSLGAANMGGYSGMDRFGTIPRSMYSLFELMTLEGWEQVGRPLVTQQPFMAIFLFGFIMVFTFGILNMIVAMVVEKTLQQSRSFDDEDAMNCQDAELQLGELRDLFWEFDRDDDGMLSRVEFESAKSDTAIMSFLQKMNVPECTMDRLYSILDVDGRGTLPLDDITEGVARLRGNTDSDMDGLVVFASLRSLADKVDGLDCLVRKSGKPRKEARSSRRQHTSRHDSRPPKHSSACDSNLRPKSPESAASLESLPLVVGPEADRVVDISQKCRDDSCHLSVLAARLEEVRHEILERLDRDASMRASFAEKMQRKLELLCERFAGGIGQG